MEERRHYTPKNYAGMSGREINEWFDLYYRQVIGTEQNETEPTEKWKWLVELGAIRDESKKRGQYWHIVLKKARIELPD